MNTVETALSALEGALAANEARSKEIKTLQHVFAVEVRRIRLENKAFIRAMSALSGEPLSESSAKPKNNYS